MVRHTVTAPFHVGLTPDRVIDAALELTGESHLAHWSIRDLAKRLEVVPSVIYHHVGGKDLLARRVVERVLAGLEPPDPELDWRVWFRTLLVDVYPAITAYPGVAKWLLMHGPTFPAAGRIVEGGIATLRRAGFDERAGLAYAALLNNAMATITIGDERLIHEDDGPRDHAAMMAEFRRTTLESPGVMHLTEQLVTPFVDGGDEAARRREEYYRFIVETTVAGVATTLGTPYEVAGDTRDRRRRPPGTSHDRRVSR